MLSTFGATTATGLSEMLEGEVSHDQVTRFLSAHEYTSKDLWQGFNRVNILYHCNGTSIPVAFEWVKRPIQYSYLATRKAKRKSDETKNKLMRAMIQVYLDNALNFGFVLIDSCKCCGRLRNIGYQHSPSRS